MEEKGGTKKGKIMPKIVTPLTSLQVDRLNGGEVPPDFSF